MHGYGIKFSVQCSVFMLLHLYICNTLKERLVLLLSPSLFPGMGNRPPRNERNDKSWGVHGGQGEGGRRGGNSWH